MGYLAQKVLKIAFFPAAFSGLSCVWDPVLAIIQVGVIVDNKG